MAILYGTNFTTLLYHIYTINTKLVSRKCGFHRSWLTPYETDEENMFLEHVLVYPCKNIPERWVLSIIKSSILLEVWMDIYH